jgi:hypothetical protein
MSTLFHSILHIRISERQIANYLVAQVKKAVSGSKLTAAWASRSR